MIKSQLLGMTATLAMSTLAISLFVAAPAGTLNILSAYADRDSKQKSYTAEDGSGGASSFCGKGDVQFNSCKDSGNVNKLARERCELVFNTDCKKQH